SAAGLLHGLLKRILEQDVRGDGTQIRIAVIERGAGFNNEASVLLDDDDIIIDEADNAFADECRQCNGSEKTSTSKALHSSSDMQLKDEVVAATVIRNSTKSRFDHPHQSTYSLRHWFTAAHFRSRPTDRYEIGGGVSRSSSPSSAILHSPLPSPTMLHTTTPQRYMNNRIIDVPTGIGWGGTTNINAGLVVEPCYGHTWNEDAHRGSTSGNGAEPDYGNNHCGYAGDFDTWPGQWKCGRIIRKAMQEVLDAMRKNDSLRSNYDSSSAESGLVSAEANISTSNHKPFHWMMQEYSSEEYGRFQHVVTSSKTMPANHTNLDDVTNEEENGLGHTESKRINYFSSLIEPLLQNYPELESCVSFLSGLQVERILIDFAHGCPRAHGVEVTTSTSDNRRRFIIESSHEIVVCAGAIGSPSLLLASGIGRDDDLMAAGIVPWYDLPDGAHRSTKSCETYKNLPVGHNLRDHPILPRILVTAYRQEMSTLSTNSIRGSLYLDIPTKEENTAKFELQLVDGIQMETMIIHAAAAALRRSWMLSIGNTKWKVPLAWTTFAFDFVRFILNVMFSFRFFRVETRLRTASINVCLLNPQSTGKVRIIANRNKDDGEVVKSSPTRLSDCRVMVDPGYLSDPRDVDALWMGWKASSRVKRRWFGECKELLPGLPFVAVHYLISSMMSIFMMLLSGFVSNDVTKKQGDRPVWFSSYAAEFTNPYYHWCGTCAMGEDTKDNEATTEQSTFVVDEHLCVRGIAGLRVCDASVFPGCISAPTALTCAALGRAASTFVLNSKIK
ncbi:hypothetical protein ACHAXH_005929, partial [Discostella pseudostelligera]